MRRLIPLLFPLLRPCSVAMLAAGAMLSVPRAAIAQSGTPTIEASVQPETATPGQTVIFTVKITVPGGMGQEIPQPQIPPISAASGAVNPRFVGQQTGFQVLNGSVTQTVEFRYAFQVTKEGKVEIGKPTLQLNGKTIEGNAVTIKVGKAPVAPAVALPAELNGLVVPPRIDGQPELERLLTGALFILPSLDTKEIYEGQQVVMSYYLVFDPDAIQRANLRADSLMADHIDLPEFQQFIKEVIFNVPRSLGELRRERTFGNRTYSVAPLYEVALSPTKTGELSIDPFRLGMTAAVRQRRGVDPFDDPMFNDPIFSSMMPGIGMGNRLRMIVQSPVMKVNVKPVPTENRPDDWSNAVGEYKLSAALDRTAAVAQEDIVRLDVTLEGKGDAASVPAPALPKMTAFSLLEEPKAKVGSRRDGEQLIQTKTFTYLLRPQEAGEVEVPKFGISVFNPNRKAYERLDAGPLKLKVSPAPAGSVPTTAAASPSAADLRPQPAPDDGLRFINTGPFHTGHSGLSPFAVGFGLLVAPSIYAASFLALRRRQKMSAQQNTADAVLAAARSKVEAEQAKLSPSATREDSLQLFVTVGNAIREAYGKILHLDPADRITELIVDGIRTAENQPWGGDKRAELVKELLDLCDGARYGASGQSLSDLQQVAQRALIALTNSGGPDA